ncbi:MAG TPA: plasmid mobilization relaxosome protein MobC [Thermoanaerobaculia bacterium]|nr:plasmid mobilization relaxosome protein MobC [Thermoanaerobaculia bacterium]
MSLREHGISLYLTNEELRLAQERARARGVPLAVYLRAMALQEPLRSTAIPTIHLKTARALNQIGNNLNQLVRLAHSGRVASDLAKSVAEVLAVCRAIERDLLSSRREEPSS